MADGPAADSKAPSLGETTETTTVTAEGSELERTIGLTGGLTIGIGTMIGAGIFVFPGLAAGNAGPAASASFGIGAVVALLVALPASELATAMPKSGGGYYFISRGMGAAFGAIIGISLWLGLVFATAFYLVGFGEYAVAVFIQVGLSVPTSVGPIGVVALLGVVFGVLLTGISVAGTENTTKLQNAIVSLLLGILAVFLGFGALDALGVFGAESTPETYAPFGVEPVLSTAALVFASYLGFAQIATVAGEMKQPGRNLPLAMVGSVVVVGALYVITIFVATSAFPSATLDEFGETAIVEVARSYLGQTGAIAILLAGLLATVSSANASILSASRALYATSRDAFVPQSVSRVNLKYGTPHLALALVGGPTVVLVGTGQTELLAEVASFLHLLMYGLICITLIVLRRRSPPWYQPSFTVPGYPIVPIVGGLASFGMIAFMQLLSQLIGAFVIIVAGGWYLFYARDVTIEEVINNE